MVHPLGSGPTVLHVKLREDDSGYPPYSSEELSAVEVGDHLYQLETVPVFANGLARGDVVRVGHYGPESTPWVDELVSESGHSTVRVVPLGGSTIDEARSICETYGCETFETPIEGMIAVDVPPEVAFDELCKRLHTGRDSGKWDYNVGVDGTPQS